VLSFPAKEGSTATLAYDRGDSLFVGSDGTVQNRTGLQTRLAALLNRTTTAPKSSGSAQAGYAREQGPIR
jgi:hypothetical protein